MAGAAEQLPLAIEASEVEEKEREYNEEFLKRMLDRVDWASFLAAAKSVGSSAPAPFISSFTFLPQNHEAECPPSTDLKEIDACLWLEWELVPSTCLFSTSVPCLPCTKEVKNLLNACS